MEKSRRGIQSVEIASRLLASMSELVRPAALKDIARTSGLSTNKAHPYMVSFLKVGLVMQDAGTGWRFRPTLALQLGLARLRRLDPLREAAPLIEDLAEQTEVSIAAAIWGNLGPTIVRLEEPAHPLHVNLRMGTVMSLVNTATGRLFAAFMPPKVIEAAMAGEVARMGSAAGSEPLSMIEFDRLVSETRRRGLSRSLGQPIPGIDALCAPVFDSAGSLVMGLLAMGPSATFDSAWDGKVANPLLKCAGQVSGRLGYGRQTPQS